VPAAVAERTPTEEQQRAIELFRTGRDLVIQAGAGTGKTTTLGMVARTTPRSGLYMAFNSANAEDAVRSMPATVMARTMHSVARSAIHADERHRPLLGRLNGPRMSPWKQARHLDVGSIIVDVPTPTGMRTKVLQPTFLGGYVMRAVKAFCESADPAPTVKHFPRVDAIDLPGSWKNNDQVRREMLPCLHRAWEDVTSPTGVLRWGHHVYLKLWQLGRYPVPGEFLLFDEAQDASPVMLAVLQQAAAAGQQVVYVGDSCQQIYEWRGAVDALELLPEDTARAWLTQSWRFGPAAADVANTLLAALQAPLRLTGTHTLPTRVHLTAPAARPRAVICRTNGAAVQTVLAEQARGRTPHLVGGSDALVYFAQSAAKLQAGERTGHPELACFDSWQEVRLYVEEDPEGAELASTVNLIDKYGAECVMEALDGLHAEDAADVIVTTAHKAKGREWPHVRLASDFDPANGQLSAPELRLLYVACTRATHDLDVSACPPVLKLIGDPSA
jgi:hypothetical protein